MGRGHDGLRFLAPYEQGGADRDVRPEQLDRDALPARGAEQPDRASASGGAVGFSLTSGSAIYATSRQGPRVTATRPP